MLLPASIKKVVFRIRQLSSTKRAHIIQPVRLRSETIRTLLFSSWGVIAFPSMCWQACLRTNHPCGRKVADAHTPTLRMGHTPAETKHHRYRQHRNNQIAGINLYISSTPVLVQHTGDAGCSTPAMYVTLTVKPNA